MKRIITLLVAYSDKIYASITELLFFLLVAILAGTSIVTNTKTNSMVSCASSGGGGGGGGIFPVNYKFAGMEPSLSALKAHDNLRHLRMLASVDLPLGGSGRPDTVGLYYAQIGIGTPARDYYVQVDTGSDIMWVNCIQCEDCPKRGYHGLELTLYNPEDSLTGKLVPCNHEFCLEINGGQVSGCTANISCLYTEVYGDGSFSIGYFVKDVVQYDRVSGDLQTSSANGSVIFGCGARQSGDLGSSDDALDGILGFGKSNSSMISQLALSGKVKKMFAHCLDGFNGGGIFAIGHVVQPKVNTTPIVPNQPHYSVNMTAVEVGSDFLNLPIDVFENGDRKGTIIDSGTTLAYLPEVIYEPLVSKIISWQSDLKLRTLHDQYTCFEYSGSIDDGFPPVSFHFGSGLSLKVYPREYLFPFEGLWCIGWQNSGLQSRERNNITLLGDLVLSNKLVIYDLENQVIGWTEYNLLSNGSHGSAMADGGGKILKFHHSAIRLSPFCHSGAMAAAMAMASWRCSDAMAVSRFCRGFADGPWASASPRL
ncbi:Nepenthesin [Bertholletia excelsa]